MQKARKSVRLPEFQNSLGELTPLCLSLRIKLRVIVDGGYSNKKLLKRHPKGVHIACKLPPNTVLYEQPASEVWDSERERTSGPRRMEIL